MRFKLLAGLHYQKDMDAEPAPILDTTGKQAVDTRTGKPLVKYPSKKYQPGDTFESDIDLVERFGNQKFAYVGEPPSKSKAPNGEKRLPTQTNNAFQVAPGGQVLEGHQGSTNHPETGHTISGRANERAMELQAQQEAEYEEEKAEKVAAKQKERGPMNARGQEIDDRGRTVYQQELAKQAEAQRAARVPAKGTKTTREPARSTHKGSDKGHSK